MFTEAVFLCLIVCKMYNLVWFFRIFMDICVIVVKRDVLYINIYKKL